MGKQSPKFTKKKLVENSQKVFKQAKEVLAGALVAYADDDELTLAQAKTKVKEFRERKVKD